MNKREKVNKRQQVKLMLTLARSKVLFFSSFSDRKVCRFWVLGQCWEWRWINSTGPQFRDFDHIHIQYHTITRWKYNKIMIRCFLSIKGFSFYKINKIANTFNFLGYLHHSSLVWQVLLNHQSQRPSTNTNITG